MIKELVDKLRLFSGVAAVVVLWTCILLGMHRAHLGLIDKRPISYLGVNASTHLLFSAGLLVSAVLFVVFGHYINQRFKIKNKFLTYFIIGQIGQALAAVFPDDAHRLSGHIHTVSAFVLAFSLPFLIWEFAKSQSKSSHHGLYVRLLRIEQVAFVVGIGAFIFTSGIAPLGEALPTVGFHLWVIVLTYLMLKSEPEPKRVLPGRRNLNNLLMLG